MNAIYIAGRGDPESWPACVGHENDPRTDPDETDGLIDSIRIAIARCEETLGRAEMALNRRDTDAAQDLVRSAINELEEVATVEQTT